MNLPQEPKTSVTVKWRTAQKRNFVSVFLTPVRTGPNGDNSYTVEMWLTPGEARQLRDDLAEKLAEGPK